MDVPSQTMCELGLRTLRDLLPEACPQDSSIFITIPDMRSLGFLSFVHQEGDLAFLVRPTGGYAYRLCKAPDWKLMIDINGVPEVTEECFQNGHLKFAGRWHFESV